MKVIAALLVSGMGIAAGPVPVPNPLFHDRKPLYPNLSPDYPVSNSLYPEQNAYQYRESNPYLPESLLSDGPLSDVDLYSENDLSGGGDLSLDRLALTDAERSQLIDLLTNGAGSVEGDDYSPLGYGLPQPLDPDWYEALGLVSPYEGEGAEDDYEDYMDEVGSWPQVNSASQQVAGQEMGISKKADSAPAAAAAQVTPEKPAASTANSDNSGDNSGDDSDATAENLVKQIDELRKSIKKNALNSPASQPIPHPPRHSGVPTPSTTTTSTSTTAAVPSSAEPERGARPGGGEAPLVDQLRAAAIQPVSALQTAPHTESETAYETIKRFLVMKDALKRVRSPCGFSGAMRNRGGSNMTYPKAQIIIIIIIKIIRKTAEM